MKNRYTKNRYIKKYIKRSKIREVRFREIIRLAGFYKLVVLLLRHFGRRR